LIDILQGKILFRGRCYASYGPKGCRKVGNGSFEPNESAEGCSPGKYVLCFCFSAAESVGKVLKADRRSRSGRMVLLELEGYGSGGGEYRNGRCRGIEIG